MHRIAEYLLLIEMCLCSQTLIYLKNNETTTKNKIKSRSKTEEESVKNKNMMNMETKKNDKKNNMSYPQTLLPHSGVHKATRKSF